MLFSSLLFIFQFLPITLILYYVVPYRFKNFVLLIASLFFYSWGEVKYFGIMAATILVNYLAAQGMKRFGQKKSVRTFMLIFSLVFSLGLLLFFKYTNFFVTNINSLTGLSLPLLQLTLPLGISFYTFQTISYTIDVYLEKVEVEDNIIDFATFVTLFPQLIAGPIVKYSDINRELKTRTFELDKIQEGAKLFVFGLGKKVIIANNVGALWSEVETLRFANISSPLAWLGIVAYALQIFFDFSGYSTMAIGLGKMLGFDFPQNFNFPYISKSVTEFWRRWHITLSSWFKEYLYIPLGGNRKGKWRTYLNLLIVWFCTGFWHGAEWNFIFWGLFFFVFLMLEKAFLLKHLEKSKVISRIYLLFLILISWSIFAITDIGQLGVFLTKLFAFDYSIDWIYYLRNYAVILVVGILLSTPIVGKLYQKIRKIPFVEAVICLLILVISVAYLVDATYNPFLYFRF